MNYIIYILKLEENKYYIGYTNNFELTMIFHYDGNNEWTNKYKIIKILNKIKTNDKNCLKKLKNLTTKYNKKYNESNVRSSIWNKITEEVNELNK